MTVEAAPDGRRKQASAEAFSRPSEGCFGETAKDMKAPRTSSYLTAEATLSQERRTKTFCPSWVKWVGALTYLVLQARR